MCFRDAVGDTNPVYFYKQLDVGVVATTSRPPARRRSEKQRVRHPETGSIGAPCGVRDGKVRALCVSSNERHPGLPEVPSLAENGLRDLPLNVWFALYAPKRVPA